MLLIKTDWPSFDDYLAALNKPARKNYKAVMKQYTDVQYAYWDGGAFPAEDLRYFMRLWEKQLVHGHNIEWAFPVEHVLNLADKGQIKLFRARRGNTDVAMHFIQKRDGYWECHPPMYDKMHNPSLAKFMWFSLIEYAIKNKLEPLDMGGGSDDWVYHLKHRDEYPNPKYKWAYVPEATKKNPDLEPHYFIKRPECSLLLKDS